MKEHIWLLPRKGPYLTLLNIFKALAQQSVTKVMSHW